MKLPLALKGILFLIGIELILWISVGFSHDPIVLALEGGPIAFIWGIGILAVIFTRPPVSGPVGLSSRPPDLK